MISNLRKIVNLLSVAAVGGFLLYSCEPEADKLGEQFFIDGEAEANMKSYDLIAYNITNNDTVRSDAARLDSATIGVFNDPIFGKQNAAFVTQLRLPVYDPDFGKTPVVDSVVMVIKPYYNAANVTTTTNDSFIYPDGNVNAKVEIKKYPVKKYGNTVTTSMNIQVEEVTTFLDGFSDKQYSDKSLTFGNVLGSTLFDGNAKSVNITKDSDASSLYSSDAGIRVLLDKNFFQSKIVAMQDKPELQNAANFIRYFKGLKISVADNDGYLMAISPNSIDLKMYYTYKGLDNGVEATLHGIFALPTGVGNTHVGLVHYDRSAATHYNNYVTSTQNTSGDPKIFLQAMGGASMGVKIPQSTIDDLRLEYQNNKAAIINAKIRVYTDEGLWNNTRPKPDAFNIVSRTVIDPSLPIDKRYKFAFTNDLLSYGSLATFQLFKAYNLDQNPAYYEFPLTKSLKNIVENGEDNSNTDYVISIGNFMSTTTSNGNAVLQGNGVTTRARSYKRAVLVGSEAGNPNRIQLKVTYGTK